MVCCSCHWWFFYLGSCHIFTCKTLSQWNPDGMSVSKIPNTKSSTIHWTSKHDDARYVANASWCSHIETSTKCSLYSTAYYSLCYQLTVDALLQEKQQNIPRRYDKTDTQNVKPSASDILYTETILDLVWKGYGPAKNGGKDVESTYKRLIEKQTAATNSSMDVHKDSN